MKYANICGAPAAIVQYRGEQHCFLFNGYAMFALEDIFGGNTYHEKMGERSAKGLDALLTVATTLAEQGELARRTAGYDHRKIMTKDDWGAPQMLQPADIFALKTGCLRSINLGFTQEVSDKDEEIDLGLLELQKKRSL